MHTNEFEALDGLLPVWAYRYFGYEHTHLVGLSKYHSLN
jgi:hypothetical protein